MTETATTGRSLDVVIIGAGFGGMYMLHKLRSQGRSAHAFDAADGVGGTWYWNRYPGARCDVESMEYSYSFDDDLQQEWHWTERYAAQPEILAYANHVADRFDLRRDITFGTRVEAATWDAQRRRWQVRVSGPDGTATHDAQFMVAATGCLSSANHPDIAGLGDFSGDVLHTGQWPHEPVDFEGKRVGVVGTGSSAIQAIPHIAEQSRHLTVFQRTPNYSIPARNGPLDPALEAEIKADYEAFRAANRLQPSGFGSRIKRNEGPVSAVSASDREEIYRSAWENGGFGFLRTFNDLILSDDANATARRFVTDKIKETVNDPATAELLTPDQVIGCKRICVDTNYFETYNRANVDLVDIKSNPIETVTVSGIRLSDGQKFDIDTLVLATGFDAMTGSLLKIDFTGVDGAKLRDRWAAGPRTYLGLMAPDFPNLFMITGPGSPSVLTNMIVAIEQHVDWIARCIQDLGHAGLSVIDTSEQAADGWVEHVNAVADATLMPTCNSWYLGANIPGKSRVFMPLIGFPPYVEACEAAVADGYRGFERS